MPILYVDNFRGFKSTFLPLKEINFFVGENSTGKTSILKLVGILSSQGFWRYNIFGEDETSLGSFSEIITMNSEREFFEVALIDEKEGSSEKICAFKFIFIEQEGFPLFKEIRYIDSDINLQAIVDGGTLKYRYEIDFKTEGYFTDQMAFFKSWIRQPGALNKQPFQRESLDHRSLMQTLWQLQSIINIETKQSKSQSVHISFPRILDNTAWFAPTVTKPEKIYEKERLAFSSIGSHTPSLLNEIFANPDVQQILNRFGTDSGLFEEININNLTNISEDAFELQVSVDNKRLNIMNVGYGVSQILPFLIETIARPDCSWIVSQQPETHLHPKAQAAIGDFIYKSNLTDNQKFIIETHTDYTIDRLRLRINRDYKQKRGESRRDFSQVVFFSRKANSNNLTAVQINDDGSYNDEQPEEFREFFIKEQLSLIRI